MTEEKDERLNYEEKLQVILHTCLLYNSSEALGEHVNYVLHGKGNKGFKDKPLTNLKFIYKGLCSEVNDKTRGVLDLDELLNDYKNVSKYWEESLRRSYSIDLQAKNQKNKVLLFALLDYVLVDEEKAKQKYASILGKRKNKFETIAIEFAKHSADYRYFEPLILLLMTKLLPKYDSKHTVVNNIFDDFYLLVDFLRDYSQQSLINNMVGDMPLLTRWINEIQSKREEMSKKKENVNQVELQDNSQILNRLDLIIRTSDFLGQIFYCSNTQNIGEFAKLLSSNLFFPNIDGFWTITEKETTNFWIFEKQDGNYILTKYEKKTNSSGRLILEYTRYECVMIYEHDKIVFHVLHHYCPKKNY